MRRLAFAVVAAVTAVALVGVAPTATASTGDASAQRGPVVVKFVPEPSDNGRLRAAWKRWVDARGAHYVTRVARTCVECQGQPPVIRTEVRRNRLVSVRNMTNDKEVGWGWGQPMDRLYRLLRRGYAKADSVYVKYDKRGVPLTIAIDWSEMIADEETYLRVRARVLD